MKKQLNIYKVYITQAILGCSVGIKRCPPTKALRFARLFVFQIGGIGAMRALHGANCAEPTRLWLTLHSREQARRFAITQENLLRIPASANKSLAKRKAFCFSNRWDSCNADIARRKLRRTHSFVADAPLTRASSPFRYYAGKSATNPRFRQQKPCDLQGFLSVPYCWSVFLSKREYRIELRYKSADGRE